MAEEAGSPSRPLDELMLAMDVVDTLRHRQRLIERELGAEDRDEKLIERLREIYASQGIDVPDSVLAEGVAALREDRFTYDPPRPGLRVSLARLYVRRGRWGRWVVGVAGLLLVMGLGYSMLVSGPRARRLAALPGELDVQQQAVVAISGVDAATRQAEQLHADGLRALQEGDPEAAQEALADLQSLRSELEQEYELRIVSRPGEVSGVWRVPELNPGARNYYIVVEALGADGRVLTLPIVNEEDGQTRRVSRWALRVDEPVFQQIAADKRDDGIVQNRLFGVKRRGALEPEYRIPTTGAAITEW